mmetsp:Transcript_100910/g.301035  ORF Transcript_100910/g.301035 Transcript_100910/m.301035 type:complete len:159 (+) Transcript_100910:79-555(+)
MVLMLAKLPVGKLFLLGVRQAARPISKVAMAAAERSQTFQEFCFRASSLMESNRIRMPREQAVQAGCLMLGEAVVFGLTGVVLVHEYGRSKEAERQRTLEAREVIRQEAQAGRDELRATLKALEVQVLQQGRELKAIRDAQDRAREVLTTGSLTARPA